MDKRVCLLTDTLCDANGVSRFIQDIATCADDLSYPFLAISSTKMPYCKELPNIKIIKPIFSIKMPYYHELDLVLPPFFKMLKIVKEFKPDIIHISTPGLTGVYGLIIAKILKVKVNGTYHTDFPAYMHKNTNSKIVYNLSSWFLRQFYKPFNKLFIRSNVYRDKLKKELKFREDRLLTIPAGIDTTKFDKSFKNKSYFEQYDIPKDANVLLYVGRVTVEKNVEFIVELFKQLNRDDTHLVIVGSGTLSRKINSQNIKNLHLLGHKGAEELSIIYASSDIFLFPSTTDTLGQVVIEAMSSYLTVIATTIGGPTTIIENKKDGYTLELNKELWLKTINNLIDNRELYQKISNSAYQKAKKMDIKDSFKFFWEKQF